MEKPRTDGRVEGQGAQERCDSGRMGLHSRCQLPERLPTSAVNQLHAADHMPVGRAGLLLRPGAWAGPKEGVITLQAGIRALTVARQRRNCTGLPPRRRLNVARCLPPCHDSTALQSTCSMIVSCTVGLRHQSIKRTQRSAVIGTGSEIHSARVYGTVAAAGLCEFLAPCRGFSGA
jgi:hypothetical protein